MKYFVFSIFDSAAQCFAQPFYAPAEQVAIRSVKDMVQKEGNQLHAHPEDFDLRHVGMFDDNSGALDSCEPRVVCRCKDLTVRSN